MGWFVTKACLTLASLGRDDEFSFSLPCLALLSIPTKQGLESLYSLPTCLLHLPARDGVPHAVNLNSSKEVSVRHTGLEASRPT